MKEIRLENTPENFTLLEDQSKLISIEHKKRDSKHFSTQWSEVEVSSDGTQIRLVIDEKDSRNPMQYTTLEFIDSAELSEWVVNNEEDINIIEENL